MKLTIEEMIDNGDIVLLKRYIYLDCIGYKYKVVNRYINCMECDLFDRCSILLLKGDKNNPHSCMQKDIRFHYRRIKMGDLSLFLSRYLFKFISNEG